MLQVLLYIESSVCLITCVLLQQLNCFVLYFDDDLGEASCTIDEVDFNESYLLKLPFHMLEMIVKHWVGVEKMKIHAAYKRCHVAAPLIKWSDESRLRRMDIYSLV